MRATLDCHALVVGINDYRSGITPLQSAARDAMAVSTLLASAHGYRVQCLIDAEATTAAILDSLDQAAGALSADSGFILYFAGHGIAMGDGSDGPKGYLLATDAQPTDEASWLSMNVVRQALERLPCRHLLVVLDCCFAGSFRWSSTRDAMLVNQPLYDSQLARYLDGEAWQALTSASHDQRAADTLPGRHNTRDPDACEDHSPFASALLRGLSGVADSGRAKHPPDGVITATDLYQYLFDELVPADAPVRQTPGIWPLRPGNAGEFVFLNPKVPLSTRPDPPLDDQNNPWLGLRAYGANDASLFFGRERVVEALVARANKPGVSLLIVVGASGTGKSSVVKAGLLPALDKPVLAPDADNVLVETLSRWQFVHVARLRANPSEQLHEALATLPDSGQGCRPLILIDQFEELYTQCHDPELREKFLQELRALIDRADGPLLVLTLRSDFEPRLAASEHFSTLLPEARYLVPAFSTEEMRRIIEAPVCAKALYFDPPELIDTLLDEVAAMPGALPLLSFALSEMYRAAQRRRRQAGSADRALNEDDYRDIGGVVGALHRRASTLFDDAHADAELQATIKRVFLRMVVQEGARVTRRRVNRLELEYPEPAEQERINRVLADYVDARLLVADQQYVEPAHDTLVVAWEMLQDWLAASTAHATLRALGYATYEWDVAARAPGLLWDEDPRLPQAETLVAELNTRERQFVRASIRRKRNRRRLREVIALVVIGLLSFATVYSLERAEEALRQTRIAEQRLTESHRSEGLALLAVTRQLLTGNEYFKAATNAAKAIGYRHFGVPVETEREPATSSDTGSPPRLLDPSEPEYVEAITELTRANLGSLRPVAWRELDRATVAANANVLAGGNGVDGIEIRDFDAERTLVLPTIAQGLQLLALSPDGAQLAVLSAPPKQPRQITLWHSHGDWNAARPEALALPVDADVLSMSFSNDGQRLALGMESNIVVWDLARPAPAAPLWLDVSSTHGMKKKSSLTFSADGKALVSGSWHNLITRYPLPPKFAGTTPAAPVRIQGQSLGPDWNLWGENLQKGDNVNAIAISRNGELAVVASANQILLARAEGDRLNFDKQPVYLAPQNILQLALSADGRLLAFDDGAVVRLLQVPSLELAGVLTPLVFRPDQTASLRFFDHDRLLLLGGPGQIELVDVSGIGERDIARDPADELPSIGGGKRLRELIDAGRLDPVVLAWPDPSSRPQGVKWELTDDDDGLLASYTQAQADAEPVDLGGIQLALAPRSDRLVAVSITAIDRRKLHGAIEASVELFDVSDQSVVFRFLFERETFDFRQLRFSHNSERLLVTAQDFDGNAGPSYAFPTAQPDLRIYLDQTICQAPVNLPADWPLASTHLLDCESPPAGSETPAP
jgi:hypothetical protein